jgi:RHS repeat-associated protein
MRQTFKAGHLGRRNNEPRIFSYNLRFPGQYYQAETGLNQNTYRDYDPAVGRYVESDPIGLYAGVNTYSYAHGNPIIFTDALGLCWVYSQSTGQLIHVGDADGIIDFVGTAYARLRSRSQQPVDARRPVHWPPSFGGLYDRAAAGLLHLRRTFVALGITSHSRPEQSNVQAPWFLDSRTPHQ